MDPDSAECRELQRECKRLGLRAVGTKVELIRRLKSSTSHRKNSLALPSQEDTEFQPSHVDQSKNHDEETIPELATNPLVPVKQACGGDPEGEISRQLVNRRRGHRSIDIPTLLVAIEKRMTSLTEGIEAQQKKLVENQLLLNSIAQGVGSMTATVGSYHRERSRFLSTFKKDKLGSATARDLMIITEDKLIAEARGDAATDALLYYGPIGRRDIKTFQKLYGLHPMTVRKLRE